MEGVCGHSSATLRRAAGVQQAGVRNRAPGEDGPVGDEDGRVEVERKTEVNVPSVSGNLQLGPASLVEGQV